MILKPLQKLPKNVEDLGKSIVAEGFKKIPKVQKITRSGHSGYNVGFPSLKLGHFFFILFYLFLKNSLMSGFEPWTSGIESDHSDN